MSRAAPPSRLVLWLLRLLLFKLTFQSGCVKLLSHDLVWGNLTALTFHYETQPLPTWIGWYAHQLPVWAQKASAVTMFGIELLVPFLIFAPRRLRHWACLVLVGFQGLIFLTGNYLPRVASKAMSYHWTVQGSNAKCNKDLSGPFGFGTLGGGLGGYGSLDGFWGNSDHGPVFGGGGSIGVGLGAGAAAGVTGTGIKPILGTGGVHGKDAAPGPVQ